jgi:hypothetical protein
MKPPDSGAFSTVAVQKAKQLRKNQKLRTIVMLKTKNMMTIMFASAIPETRTFKGSS